MFTAGITSDNGRQFTSEVFEKNLQQNDYYSQHH